MKIYMYEKHPAFGSVAVGSANFRVFSLSGVIGK